MKISSIKEIMSSEKIQMELENVCTEEDFKKFCRKYDFSGFGDSELDESCLMAVAAGFGHGAGNNAGKWIARIIEEYSNK